MLRFEWKYDHAEGGAVVYVTYGDGTREELASVANGNIAQILCNALIAECSGERDRHARPWLGYVNPPRPAAVLSPEDEDDNERTALSRRGLY